jgi:hypothetical protein
VGKPSDERIEVSMEGARLPTKCMLDRNYVCKDEVNHGCLLELAVDKASLAVRVHG